MSSYDFRPAMLRAGVGNGDPRDGLCVMQMVDWFSGSEQVSDHPECACPALSRFATVLNDMAHGQEHRDRLWPLVWQLLDSRDPDRIVKRTEFIVRAVTHRVLAPLFDRPGLEVHAAALRTAESMEDIRTACGRYGWPAASNCRGLYSLADAARFVVEHARSGAPFAAALAASAATAHEYGAIPSQADWEQALGILQEAILMGRHGEADPVYEARASELSKLLAAV